MLLLQRAEEILTISDRTEREFKDRKNLVGGTISIAGKLSDRYGETVIILPSLVITIVALMVLSFSNGMFGFLVSAVLYGIGFGSAQRYFKRRPFGLSVRIVLAWRMPLLQLLPTSALGWGR